MSKRRPKSTHRLWLGDELPNIGSGWRGVTVTKVGHKWVTLYETATGFRARMTVTMWNSMKKWGPKGEELTDAEQRVKAERPERKERKRRSRKAEVQTEPAESGEPSESETEEDCEGSLPEGV